MKIALDLHGVIDTNWKFFHEFTYVLALGSVKKPWRPKPVDVEIHILTGHSLEDGSVKNLLLKHDIWYTHLFSIADYHRAKGTKIWGTKKNPQMKPYTWDKTKAEYCLRHKIDLCLDDSDTYQYFFQTPYARFYSKDSDRVRKMKI